jgi:hypothetical protein
MPMNILIAGFVSLALIVPLVRRLVIEKLESRQDDTIPEPSRGNREQGRS